MSYIVCVNCDIYESEIPCDTYEQAEMRMYKEAAICKEHDWDYHVWIEETN